MKGSATDYIEKALNLHFNKGRQLQCLELKSKINFIKRYLESRNLSSNLQDLIKIAIIYMRC